MRQLFSCGNNCFCGNRHAGVGLGRRWNMMIKVLIITTIISSSMLEVARRWSMMMVVASS